MPDLSILKVIFSVWTGASPGVILTLNASSDSLYTVPHCFHALLNINVACSSPGMLYKLYLPALSG
jgi:hypothetical protein